MAGKREGNVEMVGIRVGADEGVNCGSKEDTVGEICGVNEGVNSGRIGDMVGAEEGVSCGGSEDTVGESSGTDVAVGVVERRT